MAPRRLIRDILAEYQVDQYYIPDSWKHPSVLDDGTCYIIPRQLWTLVIHHLGSERFSPAELQREQELGRSAGDHFGNVAIRDGGFIVYPDLHELMPVEIDSAGAETLQKNLEQARQMARTANSRLDLVNGARRGYLGWLLTRKQFLDEHDALLNRHRNQIQKHGFPHPSRASRDLSYSLIPEREVWVDDFRNFYARWRLQSLASPYLPRPLPLEIPLFHMTESENQPGVPDVSIPDIYPTTGQGSFKEMFEDALRGGEPSGHLKEWLRIVGSENMGKHGIAMYDRWFRLQHYWRLLHRRYGGPLRRKKSALIDAFAIFFAVSIDTIKADLRKIKGLLGCNWESRFVRIS